MKKLVLIMTCLMALPGLAQEKDKFLPAANEDFAEKKYADAEAKYRLSQSKFPDKSAAAYNLGNAIYTMEQPAEAGQAYIRAAEKATTRAQKHKVYHNLGNVFMKEKNYTAAVNAYKLALINNPDDDETRYNFALAKKFLKDNPPPPKDDKDQKDKKEQDEKSENKKDKNEKSDEEEEKKDPNKKGENEKEDDVKKQPQQQPQQGGGIPKQRIENLLDAVNNEEKKVQDKVKAREIKGRPVKTEKDW
ncbi:MAG: tetratricopeptide repeat protein [Flavobacterium sp.]|nr:tetratricopeptide repeat protein [Flavobacterium sp.]